MAPVYRDLTDNDLTINRNARKEKGSVGLKIAVFLAFILALAACVVAYYSYTSLDLTIKKNAALEKEVTDLNVALEQLRSKAGEFDEKESGYTKQISSLTSFVDKSNQKISELSQALNEKTEEVASLTKQVTDLKGNASVEIFPAEEAGSAPAGLFAGETQEDAKSVEAATPQVMTVNTEFGFVVINQGANNEIKVGDEFSVLQNGQVVAKLAVERLYEGFSAATIVDQSDKTPIKEGDSITRVASKS